MEIGRVALVNFGDNAGKLVTIVDVIDQNRALIDGTPSGVPRQAIQFKRLRLTKYRLPIAHSTSSRVVQREWKKADIDSQFATTTLSKQLKQRELVSFNYFMFEKNLFQLNSF